MSAAFLAFAWLLGIVAASFAGTEVATLVATSSLLAAGGFAYRPRLSTIVLAVITVPLIALAFWRYDATGPDANGGVAYLNDSGNVTLRGVIDEKPQERATSALYRLDVRDVRDQGEWIQQSGAVLVRTPTNSRFEYGDLVEVTGELETPPSFPDFDYREYLLRQGVTSIAAYPEITLVEGGHGSALKSALIDVRADLSHALGEVLPEPHASLSAGVLFGARESIPADLRDDMSVTGTSHLVAVSGQNVSILAALVVAMLAWAIGRRQAALVAMAAIVGYTVLVGLDASVLRAGIMGALYVLGTALGRQHTTPIALVYAAGVMTAFDPQIVHDLSFQLSFAATLGLVTLAPQLTSRLQAQTSRAGASAFPGVRTIAETFAVTLAAIAFTLPITAVNFQQVSLVAPLANLLAVPAFLAVVFASGVSAAIALVFPFAAPWLVWLAWPPAEYMIRSIQLTADLPAASVNIRGLGVEHAIGWYALLLAFTWWLSRQPVEEPEPSAEGVALRRLAPAVVIGGAAMLIVALVWPALTDGTGGRTSVTVMDVGQGDAILIEDRGGHRVLVDGGPSGKAITAALSRNLPFFDRRIDLVVLTHPQSDHLGGLIEVLDSYDVGAVLTSPTANDTALYADWIEALAATGAEVTVADRGQSIALDGGRIDILSPDADDPLLPAMDLNDASTVLRLTSGGVSFLLTGDLGESGEEELIRAGADIGADVLKIGHHGSRSSTSEEFLARVDPRVGVISAGEGNPFGHPAADLLERLASDEVWRTDEQGDVTISTDGARIWVDTQR